MSTCSASTTPSHTKLPGGRHDAIPSENAEAKHEARLLLHFTGKTKGFLNPITDDSETNLGESETNLGESETNHRNQTTNQYYFILHSVTDATSLVMQKWWFDVVCTCFELKTIKTWSQPQFPDVPSLISKV